MGFKHNQIPFFLQTLAFLSFSIYDPSFTVINSLHSFRLSYYQGDQTVSFMTTPDGYLENSPGNFPILTLDANIFRVASTTLLIASLNVCFILLLRVISYLKDTSSTVIVFRITNFKYRKLKKTIYRFLEFFYKTCMYPLVFSSLMTFNNWST
jgi:hypothetical protein